VNDTPPASVARQLLRPTAILSHVIVLGVVSTLVLLGQWQLDRLDTVRTTNALLSERTDLPPLELAELLADRTADVATLEFRRAVVTGEFRPGEEVLQRNRIQRGLQGFDVLTPMDLGGGMTLLVRRGWVPTSMDTPPVTDAPPPTGQVTVSGVLEATVPQPTFGARDPDDGVLLRVFHPDTARLDQQMRGTLLPFVLRLDPLPDADTASLPAAPEPARLDDGSHLSYAVQWHTFALLALGAYVAWWVSRLRRHRGPNGVAAPATEGIRPA
jgi:surfeit locus 1 family protein